MGLTTRELDDINDVQFNLPASEIDGAIDKLSRDALIALQRDCLACAARQNEILGRIERRLAQN